MDAVRLGDVRLGAVLRWSWLLGVALMAPATLPAGAGEIRQPQIRRRSQGTGPLPTTLEADLHQSPVAMAPALNNLAAGTPLRLLHHWAADDGRVWLHVQELTGEMRRGWLRA